MIIMICQFYNLSTYREFIILFFIYRQVEREFFFKFYCLCLKIVDSICINRKFYQECERVYCIYYILKAFACSQWHDSIITCLVSVIVKFEVKALVCGVWLFWWAWNVEYFIALQPSTMVLRHSEIICWYHAIKQWQ